MKKYIAKVSFGGVVSMHAGETKELAENEAKELIRAGYIEEVKKATTKKEVADK